MKAALDAISGRRSAELPLITGGLVVVGLATTVLPAVHKYVNAHLGRVIGRRSQAELYLATERLDGLARLEDPSFRDRLRLAQQAGRTGPGNVLDGVLGTGRDLLSLTGMIGVLWSISPTMAGVALLGLAPALAAQIQLARAAARTYWRISPLMRREFFYSELLVSLTAAMELRLLGLSALFRGRMLAELGAADEQRRRIDGRELCVQVGLGIMSASLLGGGLVWAIGAAGRGRLTIGDVSAFAGAVAALLAGVTVAVARVADGYQALIMYDHYRVVLEVEPDLAVAVDPRPVPTLRRGIEVRDVWFRYAPDQPWVLRGIDLYIPHGTAVALVGRNGAGKSTLVKLLCRFYDPERGAILWDGVDLRDLSVRELRDHIGVVFQDHMEYEVSIAENIGVGEVTALLDTARIEAAAGRAGLHETIRGLPRGYHTLLSRIFLDTDNDETHIGLLLSGGQRQRLALARAFMRDRRDLLILDEPSSGLDPAAEHDIHHRLRDRREGATSLLISHRLNTVRDADRIVVLADGRIIEQGRHDELIAASGDYADQFGLQADGYRDESTNAGPVVSR
ncbi:multidrug ABC transporter permease [Virgisporangium aurantiacum]|uniref:Multidrug ABC transporter permease n=2 Tax=Virgisporangium aurantiacum TaxID=175570 RepID=A0A8J4DXP5_9ACTN|nr:multidrug ABC transporter permease [Virgisporangium aurantiacum]